MESGDYSFNLKISERNDSFDKVANSMNKLVRSFSRGRYEKDSSKFFFDEMMNSISGGFIITRNDSIAYQNDVSSKILNKYSNEKINSFFNMLDLISNRKKIKILDSKELSNEKLEIFYKNEIQNLSITKKSINPVIVSLLSDKRYDFPYSTFAISIDGKPVGINREAHHYISHHYFVDSFNDVFKSYVEYFKTDIEISQKLNSLTKKGMSFSIYKKNFPLFHIDSLSNYQIYGKIDEVDSKTVLVLTLINEQDLTYKNKSDIYSKFKKFNFSNYFFNFKPDYLYIINDQTKQIKNEHLKNIAQNELVHKTKMAAIGEISTGIAHEINQPLTFISSFIQKIDLEGEKYFKHKEFEDRINTALYQVSRIGSLVKDLKDIGRPETIAMGNVDIFDVIEGAYKVFKSKLRKNKIVYKIEANISKCNIFGSKGKLEQVFINLFQNSIDAVSDLKKDKIINIKIHKPNRRNYIYIYFEDNGAPIPIEFRNRIFEPFFTTKDIGKGTGLGLSISMGILESHKCTIKLNEKGKNKFFIIKMPISDAKNDKI
ncbi:hypothetical protein CM15mP99_2330 [bacterium]|nr:MAG: hypothetical protein CM15mP99_2330 [bacterium]